MSPVLKYIRDKYRFSGYSMYIQIKYKLHQTYLVYGGKLEGIKKWYKYNGSEYSPGYISHSADVIHGPLGIHFRRNSQYQDGGLEGHDDGDCYGNESDAPASH